jgi:hypothetical protein
VAIVATVVVVGVKLPRRPRVKRGRRRSVGVIRRRRLLMRRTGLPGVHIGLGPCSSTPTTQTTPAAALSNVSAPLFAHPGPTKTKPGSPHANHAPVALTKTKPASPRANHVQAIRTALPVPPVALSMPPVVQPVPTPVVLRPFVIHVVQVNTMTQPNKRLNLLLVKVVLPGNTKMKLEKHRAPVVQPVPMPVVLRLFVIHVVQVNTTTKLVKRLNLLRVIVVVQENTKMKLEKHRATMIVMLDRTLIQIKVPV